MPHRAALSIESELRANFGLAKTSRIETVEIRWPSGTKQAFHDVEADKFYLVEEGKDQLGLQSVPRRASSQP